MKLSFVVAEVYLMSEGITSLACMLAYYLDSAFLLACLGMTSYTLEDEVGEKRDGRGIDDLQP